jgi:hypothetical protein
LFKATKEEVTERYRKLHKKEYISRPIHHLILLLMKSRMMELVRHGRNEKCLQECVCEIVKRKFGKSNLRWEYSIETELEETEYESMFRIELPQDRVQFL